jgi:UDP-N-acetyl-D-glucosamine dehydrogenase
MRYVEQTGGDICRCLRAGQLVVLESTTYPGTTDTLLRDILDASGLVCGREYFLAFSPEREDPGNQDFDTATIPKVIGGVDPVSAGLCELFYRQIVARTVPVSDAKTAEAVKLLENVFRAVNIALVNELKMVFDPMGIDVWEVIDAASTKPFGFMRFTPGPGWGGHCIPIDPFYLSWKAREFGITPQFIELAGSVNLQMPAWVIDKLETALDSRGKSLSGSRILVLGLSYKPDIGDPRESPSFELLSELLSRGAEVAYHDPHVPTAPPMRSWPDLPPLQSLPLTEESLKSQDAVIVATAHRAIDYQLVREHASCIVDTRGIFRESDSKIVRA